MSFEQALLAAIGAVTAALVFIAKYLVADLKERIATLERHIEDCNQDRVKMREEILGLYKLAVARGDTLAHDLLTRVDSTLKNGDANP